jgi:hypothetical protein
VLFNSVYLASFLFMIGFVETSLWSWKCRVEGSSLDVFELAGLLVLRVLITVYELIKKIKALPCLNGCSSRAFQKNRTIVKSIEIRRRLKMMIFVLFSC